MNKETKESIKSMINEVKDWCLGLLIMLFLFAAFIGTQLLGISSNPAYNEGPSCTQLTTHHEAKQCH